jgi:hypothetical protein
MYQAPSSAKPLNLRSAHLKIERAKKHIADLNAERLRFLGTDPYVGVPKFLPEANSTQYVLQSLPDIPDSIPLILGDAVHDLRAALDYLACEIVRSVGVEPKGVYFPICETVEKYKSESNGKVKGMPQAAKDEIDKIQPYGGENDGLWGLHTLDIIDKHRLLLTTGMRVGGWQVNLSLTPTEYNFAMPSLLEEGDVIGWIPGNHEADKRMSITADIAFGEPEILEGRPIIETLTQLANMVEAIVSHFGA